MSEPSFLKDRKPKASPPRMTVAGILVPLGFCLVMLAGSVAVGAVVAPESCVGRTARAAAKLGPRQETVDQGLKACPRSARALNPWD